VQRSSESVAALASALAKAQAELPAKNRLVAADAKGLEEAFEQKLSGLSSAPEDENLAAKSTATADASPRKDSLAVENATPRGIDKSLLAIAAPRRYRNREHLRYVARQPCLVCGRKPSDPHHLRHVQPRALGRKASDEFAVPLCRSHHRALHRASNERAWWQAAGIDPLKVARKLWKHTRVNEGQLRPNGMPPGRDVDRVLPARVSALDAKSPV
jgi:hypothetical protein